MRASLNVTIAILLGGCGSAVTTSEQGTANTRAAFGGVYEVPVPARLVNAARYDVPEIEWTVAAGTATLSYKLPEALVGRPVRVEFTGPFDEATGKGNLTGPVGTAECVASGTEISCLEIMRGLHPLGPDLAVVEQHAIAGYAGPVSERLEVTAIFNGDPIGIARIDLTRPAGPELEHEAEHD